jgi:hypothetical protein
MTRRALLIPATALAVLAVAAPAVAYYAVKSSNATGTAAAGSLGTPGTGTPTATSSSVSFTVSAPGSGVTPTGYRVDRTTPSAVTNVCPSLATAAGTCQDTAPVAGSTNAYSVYARIGNLWQSLTPATVSVSVPAAVKSYAITPSPATATAGTAFSLTLTAKSGATTDTAYTGTKNLDWSGGQTIGAFPPIYPATASFSAGVATVNVTLRKAGAQTLVVTDHDATAYTGSVSVTISAAQPALSFTNCPSSFTRNSSFTTAVSRTGTDPYGNATGTAATTVTLAPFVSGGSNANFTTATLALGNGVLTTGTATWETANGNGTTTTFTGSAPGYVTASCTTTSS